MAPALLVCWIAGGAGFFLFSVVGGRRATGSIAAGTWRRRPSPGYSMSSSRSRFSGCRARGLYPLARGCRIRLALRMAPALLVCWIAGGAGFFLFSVLPGGAVELPGRSRPAPGVVDLRRGTQCRALAPDFPAAALAVFIPWRGAAGFDWRSGWHPRCMVCWIAGGAGFFLFSVLLAAPSSYRVDRGRHLASSTFAGVLNVELSLPIFRLPRSRSLSLGEGLTDSTGARDGTRAAWCVGSRAAPAFFFLAFWAAPSSYRVDRGRHLASSTFAGVLNVELSLPIFRLRARGLYPLARG